MYQKLSGKDLDNWAEARGIKRYQGFLAPDSDEKFREEIAKNLSKSKDNSRNKYITFSICGAEDWPDDIEVQGRPILIDRGTILFEMHPDLIKINDGRICLVTIDYFCFVAREIFLDQFSELSDSYFFWATKDEVNRSRGENFYEELCKNLPSLDLDF
jgi:hypothetical protein